jgi:hypothetical protein
MKRVWCGAVLAVSLAALPGVASSKDDTFIAGIGATDGSCGLWLQARRANNETNQAVLVSWMQGFLSGMNSGGSGAGIPDFDVLGKLMDKQCAGSPTRALWISGVVINSTLRKQQGLADTKKPTPAR